MCSSVLDQLNIECQPIIQIRIFRNIKKGRLISTITPAGFQVCSDREKRKAFKS
uniref:Uncharacterized protein n=1 Tax=Rhizophora mucronata TaxID=61149 RepID=A0A2P2QM09_RHIMU